MFVNYLSFIHKYCVCRELQCFLRTDPFGKIPLKEIGLQRISLISEESGWRD